MTPGLIKKHMVVFQDSYPMDNQILIKSSNLFIINMPSLLQKFLNMFTAALDEKYKNIIRPLGHSEAQQTLIEEVGQEILPQEYGGTNGTVQDLVDFWREEVPKHEDFLQRQTLYKTDESLREGEPKTAGNLFGSCSIMWQSVSSPDVYAWSPASDCVWPQGAGHDYESSYDQSLIVLLWK